MFGMRALKNLKYKGKHNKTGKEIQVVLLSSFSGNLPAMLLDASEDVDETKVVLEIVAIDFDNRGNITSVIDTETHLVIALDSFHIHIFDASLTIEMSFKAPAVVTKLFSVNEDRSLFALPQDGLIILIHLLPPKEMEVENSYRIIKN